MRSAGYIEGYYGRILTWSDRTAILGTLNRCSLNTYLYAPKEDPWHRYRWREPYPRAWRRDFAAFVKDAASKSVTVAPAMAPGLSFDYCAPADYRLLLKKFACMMDDGATTVALLMDDISEELPAGNRTKFSSLGEAHGRLLVRLQNDLRAVNPRANLWFCPTIYTGQFVKGTIDECEYLQDLAACIPFDVPILWTGPRIVSTTLTAANMKCISDLFNGNVIVWDNYYANDYCPMKLFVGPYAGRSHDVASMVEGVLLNPTGLPATDQMLLALLSRAFDGGESEKIWNDVMLAWNVPDCFKTVAGFFNAPGGKPITRGISAQEQARIFKALKHLLWEWKGPLHQEWYPYLFALDTDCALHDRLTKNDVAWINKKFSPLHAWNLQNRGGR